MTAGYCSRSVRVDHMCSAANNATRCAGVKDCPTDETTRRCLLTLEIIPAERCPCKTPCADRDTITEDQAHG